MSTSLSTYEKALYVKVSIPIGLPHIDKSTHQKGSDKALRWIMLPVPRIHSVKSMSKSSRPIINRDGNSLTKATWRRNELLDLKQVFGDLFFSYFILTNGSVLVEEKKTRLSLCGTHALKRAFTLDDSLFKVCSVRTLKRKRAFKFRWSNAFFCTVAGMAFLGPTLFMYAYV